MQIDGETGSTLTISNLTMANIGWYRCRANTESAASFSAEAHLTVKGQLELNC